MRYGRRLDGGWAWLLLFLLVSSVSLRAEVVLTDEEWEGLLEAKQTLTSENEQLATLYDEERSARLEAENDLSQAQNDLVQCKNLVSEANRQAETLMRSRGRWQIATLATTAAAIVATLIGVLR